MDMPTCRCGAKLVLDTSIIETGVAHWVCEGCSHSNWGCICPTKEERAMRAHPSKKKFICPDCGSTEFGTSTRDGWETLYCHGSCRSSFTTEEDKERCWHWPAAANTMQKEQLNTQSILWWQEAFKLWLVHHSAAYEANAAVAADFADAALERFLKKFPEKP